jgi:hypothetical protein
VTRPEELDPRGRRLRASLAAMLVPDDAPELRLARDWLNSESSVPGSSVGVSEVMLDQRGQLLQQQSAFATRVTFSVRDED